MFTCTPFSSIELIEAADNCCEKMGHLVEQIGDGDDEVLGNLADWMADGESPE
jgi:hypothetical protein